MRNLSSFFLLSFDIVDIKVLSWVILLWLLILIFWIWKEVKSIPSLLAFERIKDKDNSFFIVGVKTSFKHKRPSQKPTTPYFGVIGHFYMP